MSASALRNLKNPPLGRTLGPDERIRRSTSSSHLYGGAVSARRSATRPDTRIPILMPRSQSTSTSFSPFFPIIAQNDVFPALRRANRRRAARGTLRRWVCRVPRGRARASNENTHTNCWFWSPLTDFPIHVLSPPFSPNRRLNLALLVANVPDASPPRPQLPQCPPMCPSPHEHPSTTVHGDPLRSILVSRFLGHVASWRMLGTWDKGQRLIVPRTPRLRNTPLFIVCLARG